MRRKHVVSSLILAGAVLSTLPLSGCAGTSKNDGKTEVTMVQYKPEAVAAFEEMEERFNATHDDIHLTIESPNEAMTVLKTRFIRGDYPDIIGIGGDINYSNFLDADMFLDVSDFEGVSGIKPAYLDIVDELEFIPKDGVYGLPYVANCAGILYNKDMFEENGWEIPATWSEFTDLCETIQNTSDVYPLYLGYKDTWTCMAPWNALAVGLSSSSTCSDVNAGKTTFTDAYQEVAEKDKVLLDYAEPNPYAYSYNDACTAFARGESAMYCIGSYAVPQILSVPILQQLSAKRNRLLQKCAAKRRAGSLFPCASEDSFEFFRKQRRGIRVELPAIFLICCKQCSCLRRQRRTSSVFAAGGGMKQLEAQMLLRVFEDRPGLGIRHADGHSRGAKRMQLLHLLQQNRNAGAEAFFVREDPNRQDRSEFLFHNVILT